jgi:hypothetical protein
MQGRQVVNYAARIAIVLAVAWLLRDVYRSLVLTLALRNARIGPINLATNITVPAAVWITGVIANAILAVRIGAPVRRPFIYALVAITMLSAVLIAAALASMATFPKLAIAVFLTAAGAALPLQAIVFAAGVMLLTAPRPPE